MNPAAPIIFFAVVIFVILCVVKDVKLTLGSKTISIDYAVPPLIGVLLLLLVGTLSIKDVFEGGLIGDSRIQPFAIMIIFNALAYLCVSIDLTGLLAYIALKVAVRAGSSSYRLFVSFFLLSAVFTVFTSNDIVILTLTPIIYYCSQATGLDPMPFLFAEFFAANICSLVLLIGNPTNIIVGEANKLTFLSYTLWMIIPAFAATATAFVGLYMIFKEEFNRVFVPPTLDPTSAFKDRRAAMFHSVVLLTTLFLLSIAPFIGATLWVVCGISALVVFVYNVFSWPWNLPADTLPLKEKPKVILNSPTKSQASYHSMESTESHSPENSKASTDRTPLNTPQKGRNWGTDATVTKALLDLEAGDVQKQENPFGGSMPTLKKSVMALPWRIVPFVFGMFVLVEGMNKSGWIDSMAGTLTGLIPAGAGSSAVFVSSFLMVTVTIVLCNLVNNQPATILLTRVIISANFLSLPSAVRSVGMFAVILGSNLGANFTLIGALAGIMFAKILAEKNLTLSYTDFAKTGFKIMPFVTVVSAGCLWIEHIF